MGKQAGVQRASEAERRRIAQGWAELHPAAALAERALRAARRKAHADFSHKVNGTVETHAHAAGTRQGALARLYLSGALSADQLAWAGEIAAVHANLTSDARVRTMSCETRVDSSGRAGGAFFESLSQVRREIAYSAWRAAIRQPALILAMVTEDCGLAEAARAGRMRKAGAKQLLCAALDAWPDYWMDACKSVDAASLAAAQAGIM